SLQLTAPTVYTGRKFDVYLLSYGIPSDFDDSRYDPDFSPTVYPGQTMEAYLKLDDELSSGMTVRPYVEDRFTGERQYGDHVELTTDWQKVSFTIPYMEDVAIAQAG